MSRAGGKPGKGGRAVTPDEAALWDYATRTLAPVKAKSRVRHGEREEEAEEVRPAPLTPVSKAPPSKSAAPRPGKAPPAAKLPPAPKPAAAKSAPPLADFDRRKARRIATGRVDIEARIDLHGMRQSDAQHQLRAFLRACHAQGYKTVLVITGKGGEPRRGDYMMDMADESGRSPRGVLRRSVPGWLAHPDLRAIVVGYTEASIRHGGEGALYVQLRKREKV